MSWFDHLLASSHVDWIPVVEEDCTVLEALRGKTLMVVEHNSSRPNICLDYLATTGATLAGQVSSLEQVLRILSVQNIDAAIIDVKVDSQMMLHLGSLMEALGIPFVFASLREQNSLGFVLSSDRKRLEEIANALFGRPDPSATLH